MDNLSNLPSAYSNLDINDRRPEGWRFNDEGHTTETSLKQEETMKLLYKFVAGKEIKWSKFKRESHINYLIEGLGRLPEYYTGLVASQSWLCFWILQSLAMLDYPFSPELCDSAIDKVTRLQNDTGGFGGGPGQVSHLATTYSAIHSLFLIGGERAYSVIKKDHLYSWFLSLKQKDGSFQMSKGGEIDIRASYCVLVCASLLNLMTPELTSGMGTFIAKCQGFDGGLGCYPGSESHGGYTFCGVAALALLGESKLIDIPSVIKWTVDRQLLKEGGFQGRTNKLVDGCYSFWTGAIFPILSSWISNDPVELYDREALKKYIVFACQAPSGGLRDKPGKPSDYYHTCYVLSGLSIAQHAYRFKTPEDLTLISQKPGLVGYYWEATPYTPPNSVPEEHGCLMIPTHPIFNIPMNKVTEGFSYFYDL